MEINQLPDVVFKISAIILSIILSLIYFIYAMVVSKQVKIMTKTLEDNFNFLVIFISKLEITLAFILLIFSLFLA